MARAAARARARARAAGPKSGVTAALKTRSAIRAGAGIRATNPAGGVAGQPTARHRLADLMLVAILVVGGVSIGWLAGRASPPDMVVIDVSYSEDPGDDLRHDNGGAQPLPELRAAFGTDNDAREIGRLKAELLRLRVLFQRLAEVAEIDHDGEFDLDFQIDAKTGDGEPLSQLDPSAPDALAVLFARLDPMINEVSRMQHLYLDRRREFDRRLSGRPLASGSLSSGFGRRVDPLSGRSVMHRGLDFVAEVGEPVLAIADGVVTWSGRNGGYGLLVELEHADGFSTRYAHNDANLVELGSRVRKGEAIATLGSSGRSTGPHLHLEVRREGKAIDPRFFVQ